MKAANFTYHRPASEGEALSLLSTLPDARILAGGQSLMPMLNLRYAAPAQLIDINRIASLSGIEIAGDRLRIGALTRQAALKADDTLARRCPVLREALENVGHIPTRARGTIGGSLSHMDPAAELVGISALHDATIIARSQRGERRIAITDYPLAYMTPDLSPDELLVAVEWQLWPAGHGWAFQEFVLRHGDFAIVGAGALVALNPERSRVDRAAVVLIGVDKGPLRLTGVEQFLVGGAPTAEAITQAAAQAAAIEPMEDTIASANYRRQLAQVLTRRTLQAAIDRAMA